jgi:plasmid stability protein
MNSWPGLLIHHASLADDLVRQLRIRAAEHGRSAEAEHREILRIALSASGKQQSERNNVADRLAEFRRTFAGRDLPSVAELLQDSRAGRVTLLTGQNENG